MLKNNSQVFRNVLFFFFFWHCCAVLKHKNIVFSKTQLSKNTVSINPHFNHPPKHLFNMSFLVMGNFRWNHYFYSFSWFGLFWHQKMFWRKQAMCMKMTFFPFLTHIVPGNFCKPKKKKTLFFSFIIFWWPLQKYYIHRVLGAFFPMCFFDLCLSFCNKKRQNKNIIFFAKTSFLTSR